MQRAIQIQDQLAHRRTTFHQRDGSRQEWHAPAENWLDVTRASMAQFAAALSRSVFQGLPVIDDTGLKDAYSFNLHYESFNYAHTAPTRKQLSLRRQSSGAKPTRSETQSQKGYGRLFCDRSHRERSYGKLKSGFRTESLQSNATTQTFSASLVGTSFEADHEPEWRCTFSPRLSEHSLLSRSVATRLLFDVIDDRSISTGTFPFPLHS